MSERVTRRSFIGVKGFARRTIARRKRDAKSIVSIFDRFRRRDAPEHHRFSPHRFRVMKSPRAHFARIPTIAYEGPLSANALAFRHYNPEELIDGKSMAEHMRFSIAYWHAFRG